jgi:signal transduction histidine kinase
LSNSDNLLLIANEKLIEANTKFAAVNKEFAQIHEQIKQFQEKQNEFINIISHELKTPIQSIIGYIELLLEQPEKKFEYGNSIMRNAERLQTTISDIRDMSKIDNNALTLNKDQFNLSEVISSTVDDIEERIFLNNKKVDIVFNNADIQDKDIVIDGDKERIIQVLSNILDNAIKFTKEGTISIDAKKNGDNDNGKDKTSSNNNNKSKEIIINIKDSGKGIVQKHFHIFSQSLSLHQEQEAQE